MLKYSKITVCLPYPEVVRTTACRNQRGTNPEPNAPYVRPIITLTKCAYRGYQNNLHVLNQQLNSLILQWAHIFYAPTMDVQGEWPPLNRKMTTHA